MALDFSGLLTEFGRSVADKNELESFFSSLANNIEHQMIIYNAIQLDDTGVKPDHLTPLLKMLLTWYRSVNPLQKHVIFQYLPHLIGQSLILRRASIGKNVAKEMDAFFLAIYNKEIADENGQAVWDTFQVPSIGHSSIYHDGNRVDPTGLDRADRDANGLKMTQMLFRPALVVNSQSRMVIVEALFRSYNSIMGELSKQALDQFIKAVQGLLQRGYSGPQNRHRINLTPNVLLELLNAAYFCIYNGQQSGGSRILDLIRQRGAAMGSAPVLLTVNSIRTLVLNSSPSQLPAASISTPSQIAKNLITNASFRAKKMGDDIPKVESEKAQASDNNLIANKLQVLANMSSISEEVVEEILDKTPSKKDSTSSNPAAGGGLNVNKMISKDKLRPKIPGFKKKTQEVCDSKDTKSSAEAARKLDKKKEPSGSVSATAPGLSGNNEVLEMVKIPTKSEKKKERASKADSNSSVQSVSPPVSLFNGLQLQTAQQQQQQVSQQPVQYQSAGGSSVQVSAVTEIESMEQIEALIQKKMLPPETVTIHSPESGTTLF